MQFSGLQSEFIVFGLELPEIIKSLVKTRAHLSNNIVDFVFLWELVKEIFDSFLHMLLSLADGVE